ncbi:chemotaxis protein [Sesbania bispinosa]|nr:chemotaxis protein [Sesbania bispinosa]
MIPDPPADSEDRSLEPRIWSWTMDHPRHSLLNLLDEEDQFIHHLYAASFFPDIDDLHRIYKEDEFITRNTRSSRYEAKEPSKISGKKRKPATSSKGKKGVSSSCEVVPPLPKRLLVAVRVSPLA